MASEIREEGIEVYLEHHGLRKFFHEFFSVTRILMDEGVDLESAEESKGGNHNVLLLDGNQ